MKQKIAVIGYGYVGKAAVEMLKDHYDVVIYDPHIKQKGILRKWPKNNFSDCAMAVVCVPTPIAKDGISCDTSIVQEVVENLDSELILIKSTVEIGTTRYLAEISEKSIVFSPEYIGEGRYDHPYTFQTDMKKTPMVIVGGEKQNTSKVLDLLVPILGPKKNYYQLTFEEAEMVKYMENTYFAFKVTVANEFKSICDALGIDFYSVWQAWQADPRVDAMHMMVFPNKRGYDGKCLPKDTKALIARCIESDFVPEFLMAMDKRNDYFRSLNK